MTKQEKKRRVCPKCKGKGEYYFILPDDVGSPNLIKCEDCNGKGYVTDKEK